MDIHFMILGLTLSILGISIFQMGMIIKLFSDQNEYYANDVVVKWLKKVTLEKELILGALSVICGLLIDSLLLYQWIGHDFRDIFLPRLAILGLYFIFLGISLISFSFFRAIMQKNNH